MSQWRIDLQRLYALGGSATTPEIDDASAENPTNALYKAKEMGLVEGGGRRGQSAPATWTLTKLGRDLIEGRVTPYNKRDGRKKRFAATWLSSLPQGIRIAP
jgi:hypothetical protein